MSHNAFYILDTLLHLLIVGFIFHKAVSENNYFWIVLSAFSEYKLGLIAHEGCHGSIPKIYGMIYDLFLGSSEQWSLKHNKGHHLEVNKNGDPDVDLVPLLRIRSDQKHQFYYKYQHWYQYALFMLAAFPLRLNGVYYIFSKKSIIDCLKQITIWTPGFSLFIVYPITVRGLWRGLIFWVLQNMIIGFSYGIIFSVSHVNELSCFDENETKFDLMQLKETSDWSAGSIFWNYVTGGLNHQVVHHLYPHVSSFYYPKMVEKVTKQYGDKYNRFNNIWSIIKSNHRFMKKMGAK